jgi:hypothetical protein
MKIIKLGDGKGFAVGSHHFPTRSKARAFVRSDKLRIKRAKPRACDMWEAPVMGVVGTFDFEMGLNLLRNVPGARIQRRG